jgi:hypothetical protein
VIDANNSQFHPCSPLETNEYVVEFKLACLISLWEIAWGDMARNLIASDAKFIFSSKVFHVSSAKDRFPVCFQETRQVHGRFEFSYLVAP